MLASLVSKGVGLDSWITLLCPSRVSSKLHTHRYIFWLEVSEYRAEAIRYDPYHTAPLRIPQTNKQTKKSIITGQCQNTISFCLKRESCPHSWVWCYFFSLLPLHQPWKTTSLTAQMFHMFQVSTPKYDTWTEYCIGVARKQVSILHEEVSISVVSILVVSYYPSLILIRRKECIVLNFHVHHFRAARLHGLRKRFSGHMHVGPQFVHFWQISLSHS